VRIPEAYREMRAVARTATADRVEVEELYCRLGKAPNETVYKIGGVVRAIVHGATTVPPDMFSRLHVSTRRRYKRQATGSKYHLRMEHRSLLQCCHCRS
jgi:hypothetical protein